MILVHEFSLDRDQYARMYIGNVPCGTQAGANWYHYCSQEDLDGEPLPVGLWVIDWD